MMQTMLSTLAGIAYEEMIAADNTDGNAKVKVKAAIDALVDQTRSIERAVAALGLEAIAVAGSDSLDAPGKVLNQPPARWKSRCSAALRGGFFGKWNPMANRENPPIIANDSY